MQITQQLFGPVRQYFIDKRGAGLQETQRRQPCSKLFKVDAAVHAERRKMVHDTKEHGGNFALDMAKGILTAGVLDNGAYAKIQMTRGFVDWHSHPAKCKADQCALGVPSPQDIHQIIVGAVYRSLGHLVYAKEGCYFIQLKPKLVDLLRCNYPRMQKYIEDMTRVSDKLHSFFLKRKFPYKMYPVYWIKLMKICGLTILFFKDDTLPKFTLYFDCGDSAKTRMYEAIHVPANIKDDPKRKASCQRCASGSNGDTCSL